jgi:hypothetical protein
MNFLLLGIDSLIACVAIGSLVGRRTRLPLAAAFGIVDGVSFLIGASVGVRISDSLSTVLQTALLAGLGIYLFFVATQVHRFGVSWPLWLLPLVLGIDNLTFGLVGDRSASSLLSQAGQQAASSALMAFIGLMVGVALPRMVPALGRRVDAMRFAGGGLVLTAGVLLLVG